MATLRKKQSPAIGSTKEMKRGDKRSSINIMVMGEPSVGKSSLISTFVSRYFSQDVPGIMTRVRLPPDPGSSCITTIVDSQAADAALIAAIATRTFQQSLSSPESSMESLETIMGRAEVSLAAAADQQLKTDPSLPLSATLASSSTSSKASSAGTGIENVDSIVLVYDLDRPETFNRLERHWLPLIKRCYNGKVPVIIAENKMDIFRPSSTAGVTEEQALARKRQQIVSLMQQFPFIRQCIKCSAKHLLRVDDVFLKAQQAVLYPFTPPLYDLETGRLTVECKRALTRIFRMYDRDHDGLLSDVEMDRFQRETYHVAIFDRDFTAWKKVVVRNNPTPHEQVIRDGKFTVAGFWAVFDVFISQNRLDVVWQALRKFGYDDELQLHIPDSVIDAGDDTADKLSSSAKKFLTTLFHQYDSNQDGKLSGEDLANIFSILAPPALPPWHPSRVPHLFQDCFSIPKVDANHGSGGSCSSRPDSPNSKSSPTTTMADSMLIVPPGMTQSLSNSGLSIFSASDSLPSVDLHPSMTYLEWMGLWHTVAAISPTVARTELYQLGHVVVEDKSSKSLKSRRGKKKADDANTFRVPDASLKSRALRVLVLGSQASGKTSLLQALCNVFGDDDPNVVVEETPIPTTRPETCTTYTKLKRKVVDYTSITKMKTVSSSEQGEELVVHLVFTDVPETSTGHGDTTTTNSEESLNELTDFMEHRGCDLVMFIFDATKWASWDYVRKLESILLDRDTPRVFVATKMDLLRSSSSSAKTDSTETQSSRSVLETAESHCREEDLEPPLLSSVVEGIDGHERSKILDHLARCVLSEHGIDRLKSRPYEEQKRRDAARRRKMMWLGGIVSVGVVVAVGMGLLWGSGATKKDQKTGLGWLRSWFGGGGGGGGTTMAVKDAPHTA